jgi:hypothetical protein
MPEISRFFGIVIKMFYRDHAPPHFHAVYAEHEILVYLDSGVVEGQFPTRALSLVLERQTDSYCSHRLPLILPLRALPGA